MSLKIYINGTVGGTDGTEITSLTIKNLMKSMVGGSYNTNGFTVFPIYLRETNAAATDIVITGKEDWTENAHLFTGSSDAFTGYPTDGFSMTSSTTIKNIGTTNTLVFLGVASDTAIAEGKELFTISYVEN